MREQCPDCGMWLRVIDKEAHPCRNGKLPRRAKTKKSTPMPEEEQPCSKESVTYFHCDQADCKATFAKLLNHQRAFHSGDKTGQLECTGDGCTICQEIAE